MPSSVQDFYTTPGTFSFTVPLGTTLITAEVWGGGGAGNSNGPGSGSGGGGGGGGGYAKKVNIPVTPGDSLTVEVGIGALQVNGASNGASGGQSYFINATTVRASGGGGGSGDTGGAGGVGSHGDTLFSGGNGEGTGDDAGGGGGGSAGTASNGNIGGLAPGGGIGGTGATAVTGGGAGGNGGNAGAAGINGSNPGGGGGGGGDTTPDANGVSGNGGNGKVILTYLLVTVGAPSPDSFPFYNEFIGDFGVASRKLSHTEIVNVLQSLRPSGYALQNDPSLTTSQDSDYIKFKVLSPNSGTVYERIKFKPTEIESHFTHLASGLTMDMRYDSITNSSSGIMEVWLDASGLGYLNSNQRWWYSGPIGLPSGMNQLISISKPSLSAIDSTSINQFGNITVHVKYENQNNNINELNIYSMKLCGEHAYTPLSQLNIAPLYTVGGASQSGLMTLYTSGNVPTSGVIPLFIVGDGPSSGYIPLTVINANTHNSGMPLFIRGGTPSYMNLFLKTYDVDYISGSVQLNIWGQTEGSGNLFKTATLYTDGNNIPSGCMNLYVGGYMSPRDYTTNMNLFMKTYGEIDSDGVAAIATTNFMPLYLNNEIIPSSLSLYLEGPDALPMSGAMNLVMWRDKESLSHNLPLTMFGPSGMTESLALFLHAQPNHREDMVLYISGIEKQTGSMNLYSHGF